MEEKQLYPMNTLMVQKGTGVPVYRKVQDKAWSWWEHLECDQDKPLWKKDKNGNDTDQLNRFGVKNTDEGMTIHYSNIFEFKFGESI